MVESPQEEALRPPCSVTVRSGSKNRPWSHFATPPSP